MNDVVNSPSHYTRGNIEVIDFIEDQGLNYHLGNAVKYITRAGHKDPSTFNQDLDKAIWYLERAKRKRAVIPDESDQFSVALFAKQVLGVELSTCETELLDRIKFEPFANGYLEVPNKHARALLQGIVIAYLSFWGYEHILVAVKNQSSLDRLNRVLNVFGEEPFEPVDDATGAFEVFVADIQVPCHATISVVNPEKRYKFGRGVVAKR